VKQWLGPGNAGLCADANLRGASNRRPVMVTACSAAFA